MSKLSSFPVIALLVCLGAVACGSDGKQAAPSATPVGAITTATGTARLPGPRMFEALAQSAAGIALIQVDLSGLVHVEVEDAQRVSHAKNCQAETTATFKEALALTKSVSAANTKLPPEAAAAMLGMYQFAESGGLERLVLSGTGEGAFPDDGRATINRFISAITQECRP